MFSQDTSFLTPAWPTDAMSTSQFNNASWESTQTWGDDDVDINSFFSLPSSIEDASIGVKSPLAPHQTMAEFYWSLAANSSHPGADSKSNGSPSSTSSTWQPFVAPLTPPAAEYAFSSESGQSTPVLDYGALSPASTSSGSSNSATSKPTKKLRTSTRKSVKDEQKTQRSHHSAPNTKEAKMQRAKNCHNLVEKKYRNRLNNNFELLLTTVTELRRQQGSADEFGMAMEDDDDEASLSSKATGKGDLNHERSMSKSDVLRLARETVLDLERKNKALLREVERLKAIANNGYC
ncbi:hypothetical protein QBC37DRAFT_372365 [Rhypophila decipiens]|uniref:BHLH domain-containing protein n=1 Tax=Rhypophila decipiens TaxID=261697 RepID=A0AAN7B6Z2_9PEZI|nr:hypothetical protein QBC37DRAFT_372365 [Rhypophila decipiens]